jgi:hypothetical protein
MAGGEREWGRGVQYGVVPHGSEVGDGKGAPSDDMGGAVPDRQRPGHGGCLGGAVRHGIGEGEGG